MTKSKPYHRTFAARNIHGWLIGARGGAQATARGTSDHNREGGCEALGSCETSGEEKFAFGAKHPNRNLVKREALRMPCLAFGGL